MAAAWRARAGQGRDTGYGKSLAESPVGGWSRPVGGHALARRAGVGMPCHVLVLLCRPK
jgi:hypothetical protein